MNKFLRKNRYELQALREQVAREYAATRKIEGREGGWIYHETHRFPICQGWASFYRRNKTAILDWATTNFACFKGFEDMLLAKGSYRPTISPYGPQSKQMLLVAMEYNRHQMLRQDSRRAYIPGWQITVTGYYADTACILTANAS